MTLSTKMQPKHFFCKDYIVDVHFLTACIKMHQSYQLEKNTYVEYVFGKGRIGKSKLLQQKVKPGYSQSQNSLNALCTKNCK